jgi:hypothetical protein
MDYGRKAELRLDFVELFAASGGAEQWEARLVSY